MKFLQTEVDIVVIIKKIKNIKEKLHKANVNGLNSLVKIKNNQCCLFVAIVVKKVYKYCIKVISNYLVANFRCTPLPPNSRFLGLKKQESRIWVLIKGTASLEVKNSERNREFGAASLRGITVYWNVFSSF